MYIFVGVFQTACFEQYANEDLFAAYIFPAYLLNVLPTGQ